MFISVCALQVITNFINTQLRPAETCLICTDVFGKDHQPAALPGCGHVFGHLCIQKWMRTGRGNSNCCPSCRRAMYVRDTKRSFDASSIWKALCEQPPERLHTFMAHIWSGVRTLWQRKSNGKFTVTELLDVAIIPALVQTANPNDARRVLDNDPLLDCHNLIAASWDSLGRPDVAIGLAIPLVRLTRLMSSASSTVPKWLTTVPRTNRLFWKANASLGLTDCDISWNTIISASQDVTSTANFSLLHLYTVLVSQSISHNAQPDVWPTRRHEVMNLVVDRCCKKIVGDNWTGRPSNEFKDVLVAVFEDLRRFQLNKKKRSLRGHDGEESVVKGIWALAGWSVSR
ncbi:hypothetical protein HBI81_046970 [Parastagonospora nodorum]|nr:hypothetical protein HBH52_110240 [Parastagonospora nodorum]KAH5168068.1 hypothetical protein HBH68_230620 [Parastagonospora nodorum]KAH5304685.1 hypothetical protein HBI12_173800 [Parastagonospora nodorum]KAH5785724.1 hypothetical protein HBI16_023380 [Parastagonospora nodorum]KAH6318322.1 hypothetical protein HBI39_021390 [Parastagonospora nodorum]